MQDLETIRDALRAETMPAHDRLDRAMQALDLASPSDYAQFLSIQHEARAPIERWAALHMPSAIRPPEQTGLIEADLAQLGRQAAHSILPFDADPAGCLGVAWAIGGSSLGNRAMLAGLRKRGAAVPARFLSDPAMPAFFAALRPRLGEPAQRGESLQAAIAAAAAVFARFALVADARLDRRAA